MRQGDAVRAILSTVIMTATQARPNRCISKPDDHVKQDRQGLKFHDPTMRFKIRETMIQPGG